VDALENLDALDAVLLALFAIGATTDWWGVATSRRAVEVVAKPGTTTILVALAATTGGADGWTRALLVTAALFGLAGDIALLDDSENAFIAGLASFAVGHLAYVAAAITVGVGWEALWGVPFLVVLLGWRFAPETVPGAKRAGGTPLAAAVVFYAVVISAMVLTATGTGVLLAALGAMSFAVSDWVLGYDRFVRPMRNARLVVHVTYFLGQLALILGLAHAV
jgi:uncharacterized membrane protein YhhN